MEKKDESKTEEDLKKESDETELNSDDTSKKEDETSETEESDESSLEIDYDAELEVEKQRGKPDPIKAREAFKQREEKRKQKEEEEEEEEQPLTRRDLEQLLARERQYITKEVYADRAQEIAREFASSESEAKLIAEIHKNRVFPDNLSLREQIEESYAIANRKKLMSQNSELMRALKSKETTSKEFAGTHRDSLPSPAPKISAKDETSYKRAGFVYDNKNRFWKKKLPSGKFLIKDSKTKQTYLAP